MKNIFGLLWLLLLTCSSRGQLVTMPGSLVTADTSSTIILNNISLVNHVAGESFQNKFRFTGDADVTLSGSEPIRFSRIVLEKGSNAKLVLNENITIDESLSFHGGTIDLNNKTIHLAPTAILINENQSSRITGPRGGVVSIRTNVTSSTSNPGNLGAMIVASQAIGDVTINRGHKAQTGISMDRSIERYYDIEFANSELNHVRIRFDHFNSELNGQDEAAIRIYKSDDHGFHWSKQNASNRMRDVELTGTTNTSQRWTLATPDELSTEMKASTGMLRAWPNPATNYFYVAAHADSDKYIEVFDISGKLFGAYTVKKGNSLKIENLSPGVYIIKADGQNLNKSIRVIVMDNNTKQMPALPKTPSASKW